MSSRDYQLAYTQPQPPAATDFWTQGGSAVLAPPAAAAPMASASAPSMSVGNGGRLSITTKAHRLLRGRYPLALTLAALSAVGCGVAGYLTVAPRYGSTGMVVIDPRIIGTTINDTNIANFTMIVSNQAGYLTSSVVVDDALADPAYQAAYRRAYPGLKLPDAKTFADNIYVDRSKTASIISYTFGDASQRVAESAAKAVTTAYKNSYGRDEAVRFTQGKIDYNTKLRNDYADQLTGRQLQLADLVKVAGGPAEVTDLETRTRAQWFSHQADLAAAVEAYNDTAKQVTLGQGQNINEMVYGQIANIDPQMQVLINARYDAQAKIDALMGKGIGTNHPAYQQAQTAMTLSRKRVEDYARDFEARRPNATALTLSGGGMSGLDAQRAKIDALQKKVDAERAASGDLAVTRQKVTDLQAQIAHLTAQINDVDAKIQDLHTTQDLSRTITVSDPGHATLQTDRRKAIATTMFLLGGLLPIGAMMLYGLKDSRFRYSDEATEHDLAGVALLGILPNLPDRLSDPQQAGIAAHCVHQIRTMLQISRANDEPQVLAVTSAAAGDGKTSLSLALGLSYAACGARTLLVDCDLLAAGLTHRLNVSSPDGILEAVANRALLEYVRTTDIADVAILPVGTTHAHHASTLSPVALRRLLSEAKKQFDIVIVDTGPILASIEASLICAAADRTILAVARNQQRPLVERSIGHLQAIGASLAGVVFNRAQAKDFERSMSGLALRSRPAAGNPAAAPGAAGVAKAVGGSFKRAG